MEALPPANEEEHWDRLEQRAGELGSVRVIVTLDVEFVPEGDLPPEKRDAQQERIAAAGEALLDELAGMPLGDVTAFRAVPQVAMAVDRDGLGAIRRSRNVRYVAEDAPAPPA